MKMVFLKIGIDGHDFKDQEGVTSTSHWLGAGVTCKLTQFNYHDALPITHQTSIIHMALVLMIRNSQTAQDTSARRYLAVHAWEVAMAKLFNLAPKL